MKLLEEWYLPKQTQNCISLEFNQPSDLNEVFEENILLKTLLHKFCNLNFDALFNLINSVTLIVFLFILKTLSA